MIKKAFRLLNTLKYLKPKQLAFFIIRRKFSAKTISVTQHSSMNSALVLSPPIAVNNRLLPSGHIEFLNHQREFDLDNIEWCPQEVSRLWRYNLHYFDYLRDASFNAEKKQAILNSWVSLNPQNSQPGWEPFTCSLRIVNWIFYLNKNTSLASKPIIDSLYLQALWLEKNDEKHILANHYFENIKALLFAGCFFQNINSTDKNAVRWLRFAKQEIIQQLNEQTLQDGGHYERSPQYHCLMLENYLDIYNLAHNNSSLFDDNFIQQLKQFSISGLDFINEIVFPDKSIPLFNDSAFDIAPSVVSLNQYANDLFNYQYSSDHQVHLIEKHNSGLYGLRTGNDMLLMDCGDIGPSYQPGHTHCDFLSYELMLGGKRLVVDTGVFEYEPGQLRHHVRSTRAHNTVSIDGDEQSEIWGEFRVARRAKKHYGQVSAEGDDTKISGAFSGFYGKAWGWKPRFKHQRDINVKLVKDAVESIEVIDTLTGKGEHDAESYAESYIHIHPDFVLEAIDEKNIKILFNDAVFATLEINSDCQYRIEETIYCPEFGAKHDIDCIVIYRQGLMPLNLGYRIQRFI